MYRIDLKYKTNGFTLIELVVLILLIGILSAYAVPRIDFDNFRAQGYVQQATATIRFGQKLAITSGCDVNVSINSTTCTLTWDAGSVCAGQVITNPGTGNINFCARSTPTGNPVANFTFDNLGAPTAPVPAINFGDGRIVTVTDNTGFISE